MNKKIIALSLMFIVTLAGCTSGNNKANYSNNVQSENAASNNSLQKTDNKKAPAKASDVSAPQPVQPKTEPQKETAQKSSPQKTTANNISNVVYSNKVIVIDPGHADRSNLEKEPLAPGSSELKIKDGGGAQGIVTKTPEYLVNMRVSLKLKALLEQKGYKVIMTKTNNDQSLGNIERAEIGNKANASLVIRIHADSSTNTSASGASMLVPAAINDNTRAIFGESRRCGNIVLNDLVKYVGMRNRGVVEHSDMTGFNWSKVPVILVEMGFLSNPSEDTKLSSSSYEDSLAQGLALGVEDAVR